MNGMWLSLLSFALRWRETDWSGCISPSQQSPSPAVASTRSCRRYKLLMMVTILPHEPTSPQILVPARSACVLSLLLQRGGSSSEGSEEQLCPTIEKSLHFRSSPLGTRWLVQHTSVVIFPLPLPIPLGNFFLPSLSLQHFSSPSLDLASQVLPLCSATV